MDPAMRVVQSTMHATRLKAQPRQAQAVWRSKEEQRTGLNRSHFSLLSSRFVFRFGVIRATVPYAAIEHRTPNAEH
jgi:hypothetical protein